MELFDLYDINRQKSGKTMARGEMQPQGTFRLVVHICIFNSLGEMLCQRRQPFKPSWSNMWDVSVGGSVVSGETSLQGACRELKEELGLDLPKGTLPSLTVFFERGFDDYYCITMDIDEKNCRLQSEEVAEVKWLTKAQILTLLDNGEFIPYEKNIIEALFYFSNHRGAHTQNDKTKTVNHQMNLDDIPFQKILSGQKTIEMRLNDEKRQLVQVGHFITFTNNTTGARIVVKVKALHKFADFAELYSKLDLTKCGYLAEELATASPLDMLQYYSAKSQKTFGVLGIEIELIAIMD